MLEANLLKRFTWIALGTIMTFLFVLLLILNVLNTSYARIPSSENRIEMNLQGTAKGSVGYTYPDLISLRQAFTPGAISYMTEIEGLVEAEGNSTMRTTVLTGEGLDAYLGIQFVKGSFFYEEEYGTGSKRAVISTSLAKTLFSSYEAIGRELSINGSTYTIVGLYRKPISLMNFFGEDGNDRIYIPFKSFSRFEQLPIKTIFIQDPHLTEMPFRFLEVEKIVKGKNLVDHYADYQILDFYRSSALLAQPMDFFTFIIGLCCIGMMIKLWIRYFHFGYLRFQKRMEDEYALELWKQNKGRILLFVLFGLIGLLCMGTVLEVIRFQWVIPARFIPVNNIFDWFFYLDQLKKAFYEVNNLKGPHFTVLQMIRRNTAASTVVVFILYVITFLLAIVAVRLYKIVWSKNKTYFRTLGLSLTISIVFSFVLTKGVHADFSLPYRELIIVLLFFTLLVQRRETMGDFSKSFQDKIYQDTKKGAAP